MKEAAVVFEGVHNFKRYACKPTVDSNLEREIISSTIEKNTLLTSNFNPESAYVFKVRSKGFLRYQVRLMMAALISVGKSEWTIEDLRNSLINFNETPMKNNAPSSGLILHQVDFDDK